MAERLFAWLFHHEVAVGTRMQDEGSTRPSQGDQDKASADTGKLSGLPSPSSLPSHKKRDLPVVLVSFAKLPGFWDDLTLSEPSYDCRRKTQGGGGSGRDAE